MIEYLSLKRVTDMHADEIQLSVSDVVSSGWYLKGKAVEAFENEYARYVGVRHCVSCANGLDALTLMLRAHIETGRLKEGDEVIVPANTYVATILSVTVNRLKPILVEPDKDTLEIDDNLIEEAITPRCRAILIVHLYGRNAFTERIADICRRHNLLLLEDCAQSHGLPVHGDAQAHSFYPSKNLGAMGDAGAVTTNDDEIADIVKAMGNYGSQKKYVFKYKGRNSRMDEIQAAVLSVKLKYLDNDNRRRQEIAKRYLDEINNPLVALPTPHEQGNVWHVFPVMCERRDELQEFLLEKGVQTVIHYPIPPHKQECYREWNHLSFPITERIHRCELSLPVAQYLTDEEVAQVISAVNDFR